MAAASCDGGGRQGRGNGFGAGSQLPSDDESAETDVILLILSRRCCGRLDCTKLTRCQKARGQLRRLNSRLLSCRTGVPAFSGTRDCDSCFQLAELRRDKMHAIQAGEAAECSLCCLTLGSGQGRIMLDLAPASAAKQQAPLAASCLSRALKCMTDVLACAVHVALCCCRPEAGKAVLSCRRSQAGSKAPLPLPFAHELRNGAA